MGRIRLQFGRPGLRGCGFGSRGELQAFVAIELHQSVKREFHNGRKVNGWDFEAGSVAACCH